MRKSLFTSKASKLLMALAAVAVGFAPMSAINAAVVQNAQNQPTDSLIAELDNQCADDDLVAGDEITVNGETYTLEEDEDGLFIEYVLADDDGTVDEEAGVGTYSVVSFDEDCETVGLDQVDGTDSLVGADVDE
jgi:hypothetical protein